MSQLIYVLQLLEVKRATLDNDIFRVGVERIKNPKPELQAYVLPVFYYHKIKITQIFIKGGSQK